MIELGIGIIIGLLINPAKKTTFESDTYREMKAKHYKKEGLVIPAVSQKEKVSNLIKEITK